MKLLSAYDYDGLSSFDFEAVYTAIEFTEIKLIDTASLLTPIIVETQSAKPDDGPLFAPSVVGQEYLHLQTPLMVIF